MSASLFAAAVTQAIAGNLSVNDLLATIERFRQSGESALTVALYKAWTEHNAAHPLSYAVNFNYGVALTDLGDLVAAKAALTESIRLNPAFAPPQINLGNVLESLGHPDQAVAQWLRLVNSLTAIDAEAVSHKTTALKQIGRVLETAGEDEGAENVLRQSIDLNPHQRDVIQHFIALRQRQCKWPVVEHPVRASRETLIRSISPLSAAVQIDDPIFHLANAFHYFRNDVADPAETSTVGRWVPPDAPRGGGLRIGYVSSDLREHAVGFLTAELFELHDRRGFDLRAYYCGPRTEDATHTRIKGAVDGWVDIAALTDKQAARRIVDDGIDILVDLNGYTKDARTKLFALRPAPIIVNWLGFPGSMGSPHHNYIIADDQVIPRGSEKYYTETVLRLRCYQPNDRRRVVARHRPSRADEGLPEAAIVFCCFNGTQKITKMVFAAWMTILRQVPDAVLWLLSASAPINQRLCNLAAEHGVSGERILFAHKKANPEHLARYPLADLFLDTAPYGAHTTASDALWMGVPVLTFLGRGFAARVCGSLVRAAGLPELVRGNLDEYVASAIELGSSREQLQELRQRLQENRDRCTLFDTPSLVRDLERLYLQMWDAYARGLLPEPDLANLDIYHDIACRMHGGRGEAAELGDTQYREALSYRNGVSRLPADGRLWPLEPPGPDTSPFALAAE